MKVWLRSLSVLLVGVTLGSLLTLGQSVLAQKNASSDTQKSLPWRIMHRVTFVSRILPDVGNNLNTTHQAMKAANINSNYELIKRIEPYVKDKIEAGYVAFTDAVRDAVNRYLPELAGAMEDIVSYLALYYQVFDDLE